MAERNATLENTIEALTRQKKYPALRDILVTMNPADIAVLFDGLEERTLPLLFRLLPKDLAAETFVEMEPEPQELLIRGFSDSELKEVVDELYVDDAVDLVEEMPANVVNRILRQADAETRKLINDILKYPEDSAGSIMTTEYIELRPSMTVNPRPSAPATSPMRASTSSASSPSATSFCPRKTLSCRTSWRSTSSASPP